MRGAWSGLALAAAFAALLNTLLVATLVWVEWVNPGLRVAGWTALAALWFSALVMGRLGWDFRGMAGRRWARFCDPRLGLSEAYGEGKSSEDLFREAQSQYLQGNWLQAEVLLCHLIRGNSRDVEARLMLATLYRHTGRPGEAAGQLQPLEVMEDARKWREEIKGEWAHLSRLREPPEEETTLVATRDSDTIEHPAGVSSNATS
jgi:hypothetical protein